MRNLALFALLAFVQNLAFSLASSSPQDLFARDDPPSNSTDVPETALRNSTTFRTSVGSTNITFTLTASYNGDLWFRMSGPTMYSWLGIGIGQSMKGALMFIAYPGSKGDRVTLSPRLASGHTEPVYSKQIGPIQINAPNGDIPNTIINGQFYATGYCKNCSGFAASKINPQETKQVFMYALGHMLYNPSSDALDAPLRQHSNYGFFTMDMTQAIGDGVPTIGEAMTPGNNNLGGDHTTLEFRSGGHAFVMIMAFLVVFPMGIIMMRLFGRPKLHMIFQTIGMFLVLVGFIAGLVVSTYYNRSKKVNSAHQIIGILVFIGLLAQWTLGFLHHRTYVLTQQPLNWAIKPHTMFLGPILLAVGLVNGGIGFTFALASSANHIYVPVTIAMLILLAASVFIKRFFQGRKARAAPVAATYGDSAGQYGAYSGPGAPPTQPYAGGYDNRSDIALSNMDAPPPYGAQPTRPREFT